MHFQLGVTLLTLFVTLGSSKAGTVYKTIIKNGTGPVPQNDQTVVVHYTGKLQTGEQFDSSRDRNEPFKFKLGAGEVIRGWDAGIASMKVGERSELEIAPEDAYGAEGYPPVIPPSATLLFDIELLAIEGITPMPSQPVFGLNDVMSTSVNPERGMGTDLFQGSAIDAFSGMNDRAGTFTPPDLSGPPNAGISGLQGFSVDLSVPSGDNSLGASQSSSPFDLSRRTSGGSSVPSLQDSFPSTTSSRRDGGSSQRRFPSTSMDGPFDLGRTGSRAFFGQTGSGTTDPMASGGFSDRSVNLMSQIDVPLPGDGSRFGSSSGGQIRMTGGDFSGSSTPDRISGMGVSVGSAGLGGSFGVGGRSGVPRTGDIGMQDPFGVGGRSGVPRTGDIGMQDPSRVSPFNGDPSSNPMSDRMSFGDRSGRFTTDSFLGRSGFSSDLPGTGFGRADQSPSFSRRDFDRRDMQFGTRGFPGTDIGSSAGRAFTDRPGFDGLGAGRFGMSGDRSMVTDRSGGFVIPRGRGPSMDSGMMAGGGMLGSASGGFPGGSGMPGLGPDISMRRGSAPEMFDDPRMSGMAPFDSGMRSDMTGSRGLVTGMFGGSGMPDMMSLGSGMRTDMSGGRGPVTDVRSGGFDTSRIISGGAGGSIGGGGRFDPRMAGMSPFGSPNGSMGTPFDRSMGIGDMRSMVGGSGIDPRMMGPAGAPGMGPGPGLGLPGEMGPGPMPPFLRGGMPRFMRGLRRRRR